MGLLGLVCVDVVVIDDVWGLFVVGCSEIFEYGFDGQWCGEGMEVFVFSYVLCLWMLVFGVIDFVVVLVWQGLFFGYWVIVCDVCVVFVMLVCFLMVDDVVVVWFYCYLVVQVEVGGIDECMVICVFIYDLKFDVLVFEVVLCLGVGYVGVMGLCKMYDDWMDWLCVVGLIDVELSWLFSLIGLDFGV